MPTEMTDQELDDLIMEIYWAVEHGNMRKARALLKEQQGNAD